MINRERNKVILKRDRFSSLAKFFGFQDGVADRNPDMYLKIFLRNNTGATFFIKGDIILCDLITGKDVPGLYIVDEENQGTISFSHMASGQKEEQFIIPVYFDKDLVKEGDYELCFRINNLKKYEKMCIRDRGGAMLQKAVALRTLCHQYGVPLLVNDRLDIALLAGADGVHLGQSDLPVAEARKLAGPDFLIGATAHNVAEAIKAQRDGADYLGCGAVFTTVTKKDTVPLRFYRFQMCIRDR